MNNKYSIDSDIIVDAVEEGTISNTETAYGQFIPAIIIDVKDKKLLYNNILLQFNMNEGKVTTTWALDNKINKAKKIFLLIEFTNPVCQKFAISFDIEKYMAPIDFIINSQLLYIQMGKKGDKVSKTLNEPKILIEVPSNQFKETWLKILKRLYPGTKDEFTNFYEEWSSFKNIRIK